MAITIITIITAKICTLTKGKQNGASRRKAHKNESKKYNLTEQRLEHISKESRTPNASSAYLISVIFTLPSNATTVSSM